MKFNFNLKGRKESTPGYGAEQRAFDPQWELYTALMESAGDRNIRSLIGQNAPAFVAGLAVYLREELDLRKPAFGLAAELCLLHKDADWAVQLAVRVIGNAADLPEWLDLYSRLRGAVPGGLSSRLRKGLTLVLLTIDEYRFSRLSREEQGRMRHALAMIRPHVADKAQKALLEKIKLDQIPARSTWAAEKEQLEKQSYDSAELRSLTLRDKWKEGISSFRIGYPALLENLQPILAAGVSGKVLKLAADYIGNAAALKGSGAGPLELLSSYRTIKGRREGGVPMLLEALETAAGHAASQMKGFSERDRVVIAMDVSNSMKQPLTAGSNIQRFDVGPLLAHLLKGHVAELSAGIIGNTWKPVVLNEADGLLAPIDIFHRREGEAGYALNAHLLIQDLIRKGQVVDKIMIFTDVRLWDSRAFHQSSDADLVRLWREYRLIAPQAMMTVFDLAGYGHQPLESPEEGVYLVSGWHEKVGTILHGLRHREEVLERLNGAAL